MDITYTRPILSFLGGVIVALLALSMITLQAYAQTQSVSGTAADTSTYQTTGQTTTGTTGTTGTVDSTGTMNSTLTPGVPNTGLGGNVLATMLTLMASAGIAALGVVYLRRLSVGVK